MDTLENVFNQKVDFYLLEVNNIERELGKLEHMLEQAQWHLEYWRKTRIQYNELQEKSKKLGFDLQTKKTLPLSGS